MTVTDTSDPKQVQAAIKDSKTKDQIAKEGLKVMMSSVEGRAWLYRALSWTSPFQNCFSIDSGQMAFRCGEVNIGLQLIADMQEVSPELYLQTMKENQ